MNLKFPGKWWEWTSIISRLNLLAGSSPKERPISYQLKLLKLYSQDLIQRVKTQVSSLELFPPRVISRKMANLRQYSRLIITVEIQIHYFLELHQNMKASSLKWNLS